ncbi:MAG: glycerol-3-phosphate dehydrogenase/oxidase [Trichloromonadaceae bacterium]
MNRTAQLEHLHHDQIFDLLVIGGGATGCGVALDAASRGLRVALVEQNDFAEGTSSRSTKLVHGGVRYLELAVKQLDRVQYNLVRDGLRERGLLLKNAPHLAHRLALVTPLYSWWQIPYIFAGLKLYDLLAGQAGIGHSRLLSRKQALARFPMLKAQGLKAGVLYYDGQFNDARTALALAMTAAEQGATVVSHVEVRGLRKANGQLCGAELLDRLSGASWSIRARGVINATGPFADQVRLLDDPAAPPLLKLSSGIHIVLDKRFAPPDTGLMIPSTEDGRVLFVLPWEGHALVGTTDDAAEISEHPRPQPEEIAYLLRHLGKYFDIQVSAADVKAVWSGLRPLVLAADAGNTARLARDHFLQASPSGLLTITGGKWTTYREMAEDAVDLAIDHFALSPRRDCQTAAIVLAGGANYDCAGARILAEGFALPPQTAAHLHCTYGDRAAAVAELARSSGKRLLSDGHPYLEAEVIYAARHEAAGRAIDVLARRLPLALLDRQAALAALPRVIELLAPEFGWDEQRCREEEKLARQRLTEAL